MVIKSIVKAIVRGLLKIKQWAEEEQVEESIYKQDTAKEMQETKTIISIWDILEFKEGSQADHLNQVTSFDEWLSMNEIRQRIESFLNVKYKNQRSLYPYLKTLVDCGFFETSNVGGLRKWRKKDKLIEIDIKKREVNEKKKNVIVIKER